MKQISNYIGRGIISKIFDAVLCSEESGWDIESFIKIASGIKNIKGSKDETVKAFSNLERELSEIRKGVEEKKMEKDAISEDIDNLNNIKRHVNGTNLELKKERERLESDLKKAETRLEQARKEQQDIEAKNVEAEKLILAGQAVLDFIKDGKIDNSYLTFFAVPNGINLDEDIRRETQKDLVESVIKAFEGEIGIIEFRERNKMRIIDGKEYEDALETIKHAKTVEKTRKDTMDLIDRYGDDHVAFIADMLLGKLDMKEVAPEVIRKHMEQTIEKVVNKKLSFSLEVMDKKTLIESFPVTIESNGKITFQW